MIRILNKKAIFITSMLMTLLMFCIVMFLANPAIDGKNGLSIIALQLSFDKETGIEIVNGWGGSGIERFNQWIFTDYLYALSYSIFFASWLSILILKKGVENTFRYRWVVYFALTVGLLDWVENTMELYFLSSPTTYSDILFSLHSLIASVKWSALPLVLTYLILLIIKKSNLLEPKES